MYLDARVRSAGQLPADIDKVGLMTVKFQCKQNNKLGKSRQLPG